MTTLSVPQSIRAVPFLITVLVLLAALPGVAASSGTTTSVTGGIEVANAGTLTVAIGEGDIGFRTPNGAPASISSASGDAMYAQVPIIISDDRADGSRSPYSIVLTLSNQTFGHHYIHSKNIVVTGVDGLPEAGLNPGFNGAASFAEPVTIIRSGSVPPAGTYTVTVYLQMNVPAGTVPGEYSGSVSLEVLPRGAN